MAHWNTVSSDDVLLWLAVVLAITLLGLLSKVVWLAATSL